MGWGGAGVSGLGICDEKLATAVVGPACRLGRQSAQSPAVQPLKSVDDRLSLLATAEPGPELPVRHSENWEGTQVRQHRQKFTLI